jgi:hypothetical protein
MSKDKRVNVFQDWIFDLTMQQQSVLILALRGPDGVAKYDRMKDLVRYYRASVLKAAYLGRPMLIDEGDNTTFMSLRNFSNEAMWANMVKSYFESVDSLPHHYHLHLMHGAQIIGFKHSNILFRKRWFDFYHRAVDDMHLMAETEEVMDLRLNDWNQDHWHEGPIPIEDIYDPKKPLEIDKEAFLDRDPRVTNKPSTRAGYVRGKQQKLGWFDRFLEWMDTGRAP